MAGFRGFMQQPRFRFATFVSAVLLFLILSQALRPKQREERHKRDFPDCTEIPAEHIDPAAIDLTSLVNTLINSSQSGSRQLFSLLSVTSYSSLALHKLTLLVYNISSIKSIESSAFKRRFCYCVTNETNDLTDFTAILLDVMGNSTSYLHELFKSASILSVSQRNNSDCIYICVMAGQRGREAPELWEVGSITPLFNQTIVEGPHKVANISSFRLPADWHQLPTNLSHISPSGMSSTLTGRVQSTAHAISLSRPITATTTQQSTFTVHPARLSTAGSTAAGRTTVSTRTTTPSRPVETEKPVEITAEYTHFCRCSLYSERLLVSKMKAAVVTSHPFTVISAHTDRLLIEFQLGEKVSSLCLCVRALEGDAGDGNRDNAATTRKPSMDECYRLKNEHLCYRLKNEHLCYRLKNEHLCCPWRRPELTGESVSSGTTTVGAHKLQPCVLELCKFFSQCLCRPFSQKARMKRYCDDSHLWYLKHTFEVCRRVRRISFSRNLKQRCLTKMCNKL
ncbi:HERV-H LTR-associating protein 1 [Leuresthes tenuis]|uniref:HERV-H LTR-associating protein 1 n=1 Tax=Leuresthes tenuis TaxID=355514 RepID=UPI003B50E0CF